MKKRPIHKSEQLACGRTWMAPMPRGSSPDLIRHLCRAHIVETGECLCPCGAHAAPTVRLAKETT